MWKVGGLKIVTAASRRIILPGWHRNWWKSAFFYKTLRTRKFSTGKFFEGSTHGILTHSRFRICVLKGSATHFRPCYSCPKSGEGGKTRFASKIKVVYKKIRHNFHFLASTRNQRGLNPLELTLIQCGGRKSKIVAVSFFCTALLVQIFFRNEGQLWPAETRP